MKEQMAVIIKQYFTIKDIRRTFSLLKPYLLKQWKAYFILTSLLALNIYLTIAFAKFYGEITDSAIHGGFQQIISLIPLGLFLILLNIFSNITYSYFDAIVTNGVKMELKNHLFHHILRLSAGDASNLRAGELMSHFSNDIQGVDGVIGSSLLSLVRLPIVYIVVFIYLSNINLTLSLVSLIIAPIVALSGLIFGLLLRKNGRLIHRIVGDINSLLNETFHGFAVIRSFTLEKIVYNKYEKKNQELYKIEVENTKLQSWYYSGGQILGSVTFIINLTIGALFVSKGVLSVGALLTFLNLVNHLYYPLTGLAGLWAGFQRSVAGLERVLNVLKKPAAIKELPYYLPSKEDFGDIEFNNVTFSYDERNYVLERFNLDIPAGKVVALVGLSGAGKSTILNLLQGFFTPQKGEIRVSGKSIIDFSVSELRSSIAHVSQDTFLFGGTIRENLLLARPDATEKEMVEAAVSVEIHDFIHSLPKGYDTEIGENGVKLSGGQKQRIAIARAIIKNAPILLLDEATSALDGETEFHVKEALAELMSGKTTIVIAHRLSTIQNADVILVIDKGIIVQRGTHKELISQNGLYRKLNKISHNSKKVSPLTLVSK